MCSSDLIINLYGILSGRDGEFKASSRLVFLNIALSNKWILYRRKKKKNAVVKSRLTLSDNKRKRR